MTTTKNQVGFHLIIKYMIQYKMINRKSGNGDWISILYLLKLQIDL